MKRRLCQSCGTMFLWRGYDRPKYCPACKGREFEPRHQKEGRLSFGPFDDPEDDEDDRNPRLAQIGTRDQSLTFLKNFLEIKMLVWGDHEDEEK